MLQVMSLRFYDTENPSQWLHRTHIIFFLFSVSLHTLQSTSILHGLFGQDCPCLISPWVSWLSVREGTRIRKQDVGCKKKETKDETSSHGQTQQRKRLGTILLAAASTTVVKRKMKMASLDILRAKFENFARRAIIQQIALIVYPLLHNLVLNYSYVMKICNSFEMLYFYYAKNVCLFTDIHRLPKKAELESKLIKL